MPEIVRFERARVKTGRVGIAPVKTGRVKTATFLFAAVLLTLLSLGCGSTSNRYVYVAAPAANDVYAYREDPNSGVLTELSTSPVPGGTGAQSVAIHPNNKFVYVANSGENDISLFDIGGSGDLTEVFPRTQAGVTPSFIAMDTAGSFLYSVNSGSHDVSVFSIDSSSGVLTQVGSSTQIGILPISMTLAPSGNVLYIGGQGSPGIIEVFGINAGILSIVGTVSSGTNPFGLAVDPTNTYLFAANRDDNSLSEYTIGTGGALTELSGSPIGETFLAPVAVLTDPSGKFLYVANQGSSNIAVYSIGTGGSITLVTGSPFGTNAQPSFLANDPSGKYLLVGNQASGGSAGIQVFGWDSNTATLTSFATYSIGNTPTSFAITH